MLAPCVLYSGAKPGSSAGRPSWTTCKRTHPGAAQRRAPHRPGKESTTVISIDGSEGEGGGQVLRTALALSLATATPFQIVNIRARRNKPGLLRQHLTSVQAAATVGQAQVDGAAMGSGALTFSPGRP